MQIDHPSVSSIFPFLATFSVLRCTILRKSRKIILSFFLPNFLGNANPSRIKCIRNILYSIFSCLSLGISFSFLKATKKNNTHKKLKGFFWGIASPSRMGDFYKTSSWNDNNGVRGLKRRVGQERAKDLHRFCFFFFFLSATFFDSRTTFTDACCHS